MTHTSESDSPDDDPIPPLTSAEQAPPVHNDEDVRRRWRSLMGKDGFGRTSLWMVWYDADGKQLPLVMPIDDLPEDPRPKEVDHLSMVIAEPAALGATSVALLISRPGPGSITRIDRDRANSILTGIQRARARGGFSLKVWPIHLATRNSVRQLAVDDLV